MGALLAGIGTDPPGTPIGSMEKVSGWSPPHHENRIDWEPIGNAVRKNSEKFSSRQDEMNRLFLSVATIAAVVGLLVVAGAYQHENKVAASLVVIVSVSVIGTAIFYFKLMSNIICLLLAVASAWGTYWAGGAAISSIDFDKPFLLSFYWSTVGYSLLTLVLLAFTLLMFFGAALPKDN
jgi:hypothetical protein